MELLMLLVTADGRLVSREEIEERLWGKGVFVDTEHGINTAIRKIRQVLRDHPEHPRFVQTVQRKGYRFIADVTNIREIQSQNDGAAKGEEFIPSRGQRTEPDESIGARYCGRRRWGGSRETCKPPFGLEWHRGSHSARVASVQIRVASHRTPRSAAGSDPIHRGIASG